MPAGDYDYVTWRVGFNTYGGRRISGRFNVNGGGFFNGDRSSMGGSLTFRVNEKLSLSPSYDYNKITLPDAEFDTHTARMRASYNFNERWLTNALVQYNSVSDQLSIFARLNYIYRTGDDLFIVYKQTTEYDDPWMGLSDRAVIMKATRSFDF